MASFSILTDKINTNAVTLSNLYADGYLSTNDTVATQTGSVAVDTYVFGDDTGLILAGSDVTKGAWTLTVNGAIFGAGTAGDGFGVYVAQTSTTLSSTITVGVDGDIFGKNGGIFSNHSTSVTNSGVIGSDSDSAIHQSISGHTKGLTITNNKGALIQSAGGLGIELEGDAASAAAIRTITNAGTIFGSTGAITALGLVGTDKVTNSGILGSSESFGTGNVFLGGGSDSLTNSGSIYGRVDLGVGDNTLSNSKLITGVSSLVAAITGGQDKDSVTNSGTIGLSSVSESGQLTLAGGNDTFTNSGTVYGSVLMGAGDDSVTNTKTITGAVTFLGGNVSLTLHDKLTNSGTIGTSALAKDGTVTFSLGTANDTFTNTGTVYGDVILGGGDDSFSNTKTVTGVVTFDSGNGSATINDKFTNSGTIENTSAEVFAVTLSTGNDTFTNSGTVTGGVDLGIGSNTFTNTKNVLGDVTALGSQKNVITNSGVIGVAKSSGDLTLGGGNDVVNNTGSILGAILLGAGDDSLTSSKLISGDVTFDGGGVSPTANDKFTNSGTVGDSSGDAVTFFSGVSHDTFSNSGSVNGNVLLGEGNDVFTNTKSIVGTVTFGAGDTKAKVDDKFTNSGTIGVETIANSGDVTGGAGNDTFANSGIIYGNLNAGDGNDTISSTKTLAGSLIAGDGDNVITTGGTIGGNITGGAGSDTLTNAATVAGYVNLGAGKLNTFTNTGKINGANSGISVEIASVTVGTNIETAPGDRYVFSNSGTIFGDVSINAGLASIGTKAAPNAGTFTNSGTIGVVETDTVTEVASNVYLSEGVDVVNNTGTVVGTFYLGAGNDKFTGGANNDHVQDGKGADDIQLGGDKYSATADPESPGDVYFAGGAGGSDGTDTIDGGAGAADFYVAGTIDGTIDGVNSTVFINLDTVTQSENEFLYWSTKKTVTAQSAYGTDVSGTIDDSVRDIIKNFEWAAGGDGDDVIFGSSASNVLFGDNPQLIDQDSKIFNPVLGGDDIIYGGAGNDTIFGGGGGDVLVGGAGKDLLYGGEGSDVFAFVKRTDSGTLVAARDVIYDFVQGEDFIDFSALAKDEAVALDFIGLNTNWSGAAGELRTIWTATSTIIQIDLLGNGKPLFNVELFGRYTLTEADLILTAPDDVATANADLLFGGTGNDTIDGLGGDDRIYGRSGVDNLTGGAGNDTLVGGAGSDILDGGANTDTAVYAGSLINDGYGLSLSGSDLIVDGTGNGFGEGVDKLISIENITFADGTFKLVLGTTGDDDPLSADASIASLVLGFGGDDVISSGAGDDILVGGDNTAVGDTLSFANQTLGVTVNMDIGDGLGKATGTGIGTDYFGEFENVVGGSGADTITGDGNDNTLAGGAGADVLTGDAGTDSFYFTAGDSGQTVGTIDKIADYDGSGDSDIIVFDGTLVIGGDSTAATATEAQINATTGVATFFAGSGTTLTDALQDIATRFNTAGNTAGDFALFQVGGTGNYHLFISDGVAGVTANDVVVELSGVTTVTSISLPNADELLIV